MKVLSKGTINGLRALIYMSSKKDRNQYVTIGEMSKELDISFHFLTKTFQVLTQNGIVESHRGPAGGILFKKPIERIFLIDVVHILEGQDFFEKCLLGLPGCGSNEPCPVHEFWKNVKGILETEFRETTLAYLAKNIQLKKMRI